MVVFLALVPSLARAEVKVGLVDLQKALQEVKKGRSAKSSLEKEFQEKKKKIEAEQSAIKKDSDEFQKKSSLMAEKARVEKGTKIQQRMSAWQELVQKSQIDIQGREAELTRPILDGLRAMIPDLARKKKLDLVVEQNTGGLLYAVDKSDLTEELIRAYDEKNP